jgi:hypothetical protein
MEGSVYDEGIKMKVCDFFANILSRHHAVELKAITRKYNSYEELVLKIHYLSVYLTKKIKKKNSSKPSKDERDRIDAMKNKKAILNADKEIIDRIYTKYHNNPTIYRNNYYAIDKDRFFKFVRENCEVRMNNVVPVAMATHEEFPVATATYVGFPVATATATATYDGSPDVIARSLGGKKTKKRKTKKSKSRKQKPVV